MTFRTLEKWFSPITSICLKVLNRYKKLLASNADTQISTVTCEYLELIRMYCLEVYPNFPFSTWAMEKSLVGWLVYRTCFLVMKRPWAPGLGICVSTSRLMNLLLDDERKVNPASRKQLDPIHVPKGLNSTFVFLWIRDKLINLLIVGAPIYPRISL